MATRRTTRSTPHCCVSLSVISALYLLPLVLLFVHPCFLLFFLSAFSVSLHLSVISIICLLLHHVMWFELHFKLKKQYVHCSVFGVYELTFCIYFFHYFAFCQFWKLLLILRKCSGHKNGTTMSNTHSTKYIQVIELFPLSSSPRWLHCVPVMWNGIPAGGLQESGVLHWEHWNRCCHELDNEPYGWPRCAEQREFTRRQLINQSDCSSHSSRSPLSHWLQISRPPWCCQAAVPAPGPLPQRASPRSTWQPSSPWASAETRQPKHFEPRLESNSVRLEMGIWLISHATCLKVELCQYGHSCSLFYSVM